MIPADPARPADEPIELDPGAADRQRRLRDRHFNVRVVPRLRVFGFVLLALVVLVDNTLVRPPFSARAYTRFALSLLVYSALSWLVLRRYYGRTGPLDLGRTFLAVDVVFILTAINITGGEKSWLIFLLMVRVADQVHTTFRQVRFFAHLTMVGYLLLLVYMAVFEHHQFSWLAELAKGLLLYCANLYVSYTALEAEKLRHQRSSAIRVARRLIADLQDHQEQLEEARLEAEGASRLKSEFIANVSHEIRTPLNGIIGMTALALQGGPSEPREHLHTIRSSADVLLKIVDDLLDFSRIEGGRLELQRHVFSLEACLDGVAGAYRAEARRKGVELTWIVAPGVPDSLVGDRKRLGQVVTSLVDNAVKFTDSGRIELKAELSSFGPQELSLHVSVKDTGIGIPAEKRAMIFEPFTQADGSLTRRHGGTGLGLTLSSRLVAAMGGRLWGESELGVGSTFHFTARFGFVLGAGPAGRGTPPASQAENELVVQTLANASPAGADSPQPAVAIGSGPRPASFDHGSVLARLGQDEDLFKDLAQIFLDDLPRLQSELRAAVKSRDPKAIVAAAHAINGSVALFSAGPSCQAATRLERIAPHAEMEAVEEQTAALEAEMERLRGDLLPRVSEAG